MFLPVAWAGSGEMDIPVHGAGHPRALAPNSPRSAPPRRVRRVILAPAPGSTSSLSKSP